MLNSEQVNLSMNDVQDLQVCQPLPTEEAIRYATSLAELLRRMHRDGVFYGCLEPKDIAWDNREIKLVQNDHPHSGAYMAPEQVRGEASDTRSDIFAFGAILYELLSGRKAFPAQDTEELKRQILESTPKPLEGLPEGIASLLRGCLEKDRDFRLQRMSSILIELKLASATAKQAHSATEWREKVLTLRSHVAEHDEKLAEQRCLQETAAAELRKSIQRIEATLAAIQEAIGVLQKNSQLNTKAIDGLQVAASQTDEVVEHVVEAFGMMHKSMVERGDAKVLVARHGA
jgi:serine/threonine protein kinase